MRIGEIFNLGKTQFELDFIDIDISTDTPLFIDPFFLSIRNDNWSIEATSTIRNFFQRIIDLIRTNQIIDAKILFRHLHEPNSTCLGFSRGIPRGRGIGHINTDDIFNSIIRSRAIQTGLVEHLEDNILFVDGFGKDKLSDMTTNIIRRHLLDYTITQCQLHGITMQDSVPSGFYWNRNSIQWEQIQCRSLIIDGRRILLVPKGVVSFCSDYIPTKYYQHYVLNFMQSEHLQINSALVQERKNGELYVTKKDLQEQNPYSKEFLVEFSQRNPTVLQSFRESTTISSLTNLEIADINVNDLTNYLITKLQNINPGNASATDYHRTIAGILELLFYPHLIYPDLEQEIHSGRKRIDIRFDNAADEGIFHRFSNNMDIPCSYIMMECKNYSSDPANPELDQLSGRFSPNRGQIGFLVCRTIDNMDRFINRCRDTFADQRGLIIPLVDNDIIELLQNYDNWHSNFMDRFISARVRQIAVN